jgi:Cu(I)/Ag(I) efflux system membrane fusion protein
MATQTRKGWRTWAVFLTLLVGIAAGAGGAWAHYSGLLTPLYHQLGLHALAGAVPAAPPDHEDKDMSGMNMPGMDMGSVSPAAKPSPLPGYTVVKITPERQQLIGVRTGRVERGRLQMSLQVVGVIEPDQTRITHEHLKTEGWVQKLFVDFIGRQVKKGDPLLSIYSPDFVTTQQQYLDARKAGQPTLADLARQRLQLWDVPADEIKEIEDSGKPKTNLTLRSHQDGTVLARNAFEGQYVTPEMELFTLADLSTVWVQAKVYEYELPHVELHQPVHVSLPAQPDVHADGAVEFVEPVLDEATRTAKVRVPLDNRAGLFKPGMYADLIIDHDMSQTPRSVESASVVGLLGTPAGLGPFLAASALAAARTGLLVPESGLLRTGERDLAFRVLPDNYFEPVEVKLGARFGERYQVLAGLSEGDEVVTSAAFLIDAESRLKSATSAMTGHHHGDTSPKQPETPPAPKGDDQGHEHHHHGM